jgi:hypothetical protein
VGVGCEEMTCELESSMGVVLSISGSPAVFSEAELVAPGMLVSSWVGFLKEAV